MDKESIGTKAVRATKWSLATQVASKLIQPVTTLILAHLLAPDVFGIVALVTMVTSFADMFSDAGFQKYLIQHEYETQEHYALSCNVAFWTNLVVSLALWAGISIFKDSIAFMLGDGSIGLAIAIACSSLPLTSAVSVQTAVYQRSFDFKTLFYSRVGSSLAILLVSVPLAVFGFGYWSMIAGTIASNLLLAVWLTVRSSWKPSFSYSFGELREMFSFSAWTLVEAFSIWVTNWVGAFILGSLMSTYYLGLYNTSVSSVNAVLAIVTSAVNPVMFASLSRFQSDREKFDSTFYKMQKCLAFGVVPIAVALCVFSDAAVGIYLGESWLEASLFFGLYSLASAFVVVFGHMASNAYRSIGRPRLSLFAQLGFLAFLVPGLIIGATFGFEVLSVVVPAFRLCGSLVTHFIICKFFMGLSPWKMIKNMRWIYFAAATVGIPFALVIRCFSIGYLAQCLFALVAMVIYFAICVVVKDLRKTMLEIADRFGFGKKLTRLIPKRFLQ